MISVSQNFDEAMKTRRDFKCRAHVTFADDSEMELLEDDFSVTGNHIATGCGSTSSFPIGNAVGRTAYLELVNHDGRFDDLSFQGAKLILSLVFINSVGDEEIIQMGTFTVIDPETKGNTVILTAHDDMHLADIEYVPTISFPANLVSLVIDVCKVCGITFLPEFAPPFPDIMVNAAPTEYTCRQILASVSMICGGNAVITRYNLLSFPTFPSNSLFYHTISRSNSFSLSADRDPISITGVSAKVTEIADGNVETKTVLIGEEGYVIPLDNPLWAGNEETILRDTLAPLLLKSFSRFDASIPADPRMQFMDAVSYLDEDGNERFSFITDLDFYFLGATEVSCSAPDTSMVNGVYKIDKNPDKKIEAVNEEIAQLKNNGKTIEAIVQGLQSTVSATMSSSEIRAEIKNAVDDINSIDTGTGVVLDSNGLTVYETGNNIKNLLTNEGMKVQRVAGNGSLEENILTADTSGVDAVNLTARKYLIIGENSRFEDFIDDNGEKRTACFWIG